jgi:hypothetical protein
MPKSVEKLIGDLDQLTTKIEYTLDDYGESPDDILGQLADVIENLTILNDELDSNLEEE